MANAVRIWEEQYQTLKKLPKKDQAKMALAMLEFAFDGSISVDLNYVQDLAITPMKPSLKITKTGGCPKGKVRNPAGLNQHSVVKGYPNPNPNGLDKRFINNNIYSHSHSLSGNSDSKKILDSGIREKEKFIPPTLQQVIDYAAQQNELRGVGGFRCARSTAEEFWAHYDSQGWRKSNDSATPVTNWHSALRLWTKKQCQFENPTADMPL